MFFYQMMLDCWQQAATKRPTFKELLGILQPIATSPKLKEANEDELVAGSGTKFGSWRWCGPEYAALERNWAENKGVAVNVSPCGWRSANGTMTTTSFWRPFLTLLLALCQSRTRRAMCST